MRSGLRPATCGPSSAQPRALGQLSGAECGAARQGGKAGHSAAVRRPRQGALLPGSTPQPHVPGSVPRATGLLSPALLPARRWGHLLPAGTGPACPGPEFPLPTSPGTSGRSVHPALSPAGPLPACLTAVSLRCGHLLLGGFPFFIRFDNAFFRD